jgi:hypothetical protein
MSRKKFGEFLKEEEKAKVIKVEVKADEATTLTTKELSNLEAYNAMKAFGMSMENNLPTVTLLRSHPCQQVAKAADILEKDIRSVINYILNLQIPL